MSDYSNKQLIEETTLWGIDFYKRTRVEEHEIQINAQQNITEFPGMVVAGKEPLTNSSFTAPGSDWTKIAKQTIELTLLNLIINDFIELVVFRDAKTYLNNIFIFEYEDYHLSVKNKYSGKDYLSKSIFQSVRAIERRMKKKALLQDVIDSLIEKHLYRSEPYKQPQKSFVFELIKRYTPDHSWMTSEFRTVFFREKIELDIIPKKQEEFKNAHKTFAEIRKILRQESPAFRKYIYKLNEMIEAEFAKRKSSN